MPDKTSIERLQEIVEKRLPASLNAPSSKPAPPLIYPDAITRAAAWGIIVLLLMVPMLAPFLPRPNLMWIPWSIVSVWAALDSRQIAAALRSPARPLIGGRAAVIALAALNLLTAIYALLLR